MTEKEEKQIEELIEQKLTEKLGRKVVFAGRFMICNVPIGKGKAETDVVLVPEDSSLPAVCMDLMYLFKSYGETMGITEESVNAELEKKKEKKQSYVS